MIIECKCQKYKFQIPGNGIIQDGKLLKCGFCDEEWFHNKLTTDTDIPLPTKNQKKKVQVSVKPNKNLIVLIVIFLLIALFVGMLFNRDLVLSKYPNFVGCFESADILGEIIIQNANWIKEIIQNLFKK